MFQKQKLSIKQTPPTFASGARDYATTPHTFLFLRKNPDGLGKIYKTNLKSDSVVLIESKSLMTLIDWFWLLENWSMIQQLSHSLIRLTSVTLSSFKSLIKTRKRLSATSRVQAVTEIQLFLVKLRKKRKDLLFREQLFWQSVEEISRKS